MPKWGRIGRNGVLASTSSAISMSRETVNAAMESRLRQPAGGLLIGSDRRPAGMGSLV